MLKELVVYVHFYLRDSKQLNVSFPLPSCMSVRNLFRGCYGRQDQLLLVTHKYPAVRINEDMPNSFSLFAEAIVLPYELVSLEKNILEESDEILFNKLPIDDVTSKKRTCQAPCLLAFRNSDSKAFLKLGTRFSKLLSGRGSVAYVTNKQFLQKVLLEFKSDCFNKYKLMNRGEVYILYSSEGALRQTKTGYLHSAKLQIDCHTTVMGISFPFDKVACQEESPANYLADVSHKVKERTPDCPQRELILQHSSDLIHEISDDRLLLSFVHGEMIKEKTKEVKDGFIHLIKLLKEPASNLSVSSCIEIMRAQPTGSYEVSDAQGSKMSQGMLVSLTGNIENTHIWGYYSNYDVNNVMDTNEMSCRICIHVHDGTHMIKIRGNLSKYNYPIGLGPGGNATFHRVLITSCHELMLSPVSFIVVNSVKEPMRLSSDRESCSGSRDYIPKKDPLDVVPLCLISECLYCTKGKLVRFRCRVVAVHILVLQSQTQSFVKCPSEYLVETPTSKIPLAGYVLDDGSSLCLCWTDGSNAETLLRMQEVQACHSFHNYKRSNRARDKPYQDRTPRNSMYHYLEKILRKHHRVTVSNRGILPDLSCLDLTFSAASNKVLTSKEENFLKFVILDACSGPNFDLICCTTATDIKGLHGFKSERLQSPISSLPNVWLKEVYKVNPLKEAKDVLRELL